MEKFYEANPDLKPNPSENYRLTDYMWERFNDDHNLKPKSAKTPTFRKLYEAQRDVIVEYWYQPRKELSNEQNTTLLEAIKVVLRRHREEPITDNNVNNLQTYIIRLAHDNGEKVFEEKYLGSKEFIDGYNKWLEE